MSEYYKLRRTKITDAFALLGFLVGFFIRAYTAGRQLAEGFDTGLITEGIFRFVTTVLGTALLGGIIGLATGIMVGFLWEQLHRLIRKPDVAAVPAWGPDRDRAPERAVQATRADAVAAGLRAERQERESRPYVAVRYDDAGFTAAEFASLAERAIGTEYDAAKLGAALDRTVNVGAWVGDKLVGAVRILTDGYLLATIPDVMVDPEYRRRGIGRELMSRALDAAPTGVIFFGAPPESVAFFEHLGCQRAPTGYVLRRKLAPAVRTR